jgi:hypothetical protein
MALSSEVQQMIASAEAGDTNYQLFASRETQELQLALVLWVESGDAAWAGSAVLGPSLSFQAAVSGQLYNAAGQADPFNQSATLIVTATGSHSPLVNGMSGPQTLTAVDGAFSFSLSASAAGSVSLAWSGTSLTTTGLPSSVSLA